MSKARRNTVYHLNRALESLVKPADGFLDEMGKVDIQCHLFGAVEAFGAVDCPHSLEDINLLTQVRVGMRTAIMCFATGDIAGATTRVQAALQSPYLAKFNVVS